MADILTQQLVDAIADELGTNRCNYHDILKRLGWDRSRYKDQDWSEIKTLTEEKIGCGVVRISLMNVAEPYFYWLDASPARQRMFKIDGKLVNPHDHPRMFCPVNKTPDGVIMIGQATQAMRDYVAANRLNHLDARIEGAVRLGDTSFFAGDPIPALQRKALQSHVKQVLGTPPTNWPAIGVDPTGE
jgi:hypothetical protein